MGAARRQAASAQRLRRQIQPTLLHRRRLRPRSCRPRGVHRRAGAGWAVACARSEGALRDRSGESLPGPVHRTRARAIEGWARARRAPSAHARRRARAAVTRGYRGKVQAELRLWRLDQHPGQALSCLRARRLRPADRDVALAGERAPARDVGTDELAELLRRHRHRLERLARQALAQRRRGERLVDLSI